MRRYDADPRLLAKIPKINAVGIPTSGQLVARRKELHRGDLRALLSSEVHYSLSSPEVPYVAYAVQITSR